MPTTSISWLLVRLIAERRDYKNICILANGNTKDCLADVFVVELRIVLADKFAKRTILLKRIIKYKTASRNHNL